MTDLLYTGDIGTQLRISLLDGEGPLDISGATDKSLLLRKPSGTCLTKTPTFATDGSDGVLVYSLEAGVLDESGTWQIQARVTLPNGTWSSARASFGVARRLCET